MTQVALTIVVALAMPWFIRHNTCGLQIFALPSAETDVCFVGRTSSRLLSIG